MAAARCGTDYNRGVKKRGEVVIEVRGVELAFESPSGRMQPVLRGISFDVHRGETLVIMGASGCGKSTLLNCMIGELHPQKGSITYYLPDGPPVDLCRADPDDADRVRRRFGILFQSGALFSSMTVAENVALPLREHSNVDPSVVDIVVAMKLQQVNMLPHRDKLPAQLSGGQKKRVGLARALGLDPAILFYDEPSAGLDPVTSSTIDELVIDLAAKLEVTSVIVTHEMDSAFRVSDRMIMLDQGRILRDGTRQEFEALRDAQPGDLESDEARLIQRFLNGVPAGPLTDAHGLSLYERLLRKGPEDSSVSSSA